MRRFVSLVEIFTEGGAAATVDGDNVFDDGVDAGPDLRAFGDRGDSEGGRDFEVAEDVSDKEFGAEDEHHRGYWHGEESDRGVIGDSATTCC